MSKKARSHRSSRPAPPDRRPPDPARGPAAGERTGRRVHPVARDSRPFWKRNASALISALVLVGVVGFGAWVFLQATRPAYACQSLLTAPPATPTPAASSSPAATPTPAAPTPQLGFPVADRGNKHGSGSDTLTFGECPPSSGTHDPQPATRGFHGPGDAVRPGAWLHSMEHGYVALLYSCGAGGTSCPDPETLDALRAFADNAPQSEVAGACGLRNKLVVARFDDMSAPFAALGWDRVLLNDTFDQDLFLSFYGQWVDNAPTSEAKEC